MTAGQLRRLMHNLDDDDEVQFTATVKANEVHTTPKTTLFEVVLRGNKFKLDDTPSTSFSVRLLDASIIACEGRGRRQTKWKTDSSSC